MRLTVNMTLSTGVLCTSDEQHQTSRQACALRRRLLAMRNRLTADDVRGGPALWPCRALELPELAHARTVAAYVSVGSEPGTLALLDALRARGVRVLLPVLLPDNDLDWGAYAGEGSLARVRHGGRRPCWSRPGARLGPDAVTGRRRGAAARARGRPARDAAGARRRLVRPGAGPAGAAPGPTRRWWCCCTTARCVDAVPAEAHDRPVHAAVTPSGVRRFTLAR